MIKSLYPIFQRWSEKGSVYIISDTHFEDDDCKFMDPNWPDVWEQVQRIRQVVHKNDTLIHLGDVGDPKYMMRIPGHHVLVMGNHDVGKTLYEEYFHEVYDGPLWIGEKIVLSHEPIEVLPHKGGYPIAVNLHGHVHCSHFKYTDYHYCFASDVIDYRPVSLGSLIKNGMLSNVFSLRRQTIDFASDILAIPRREYD